MTQSHGLLSVFRSYNTVQVQVIQYECINHALTSTSHEHNLLVPHIAVSCDAFVSMLNDRSIDGKNTSTDHVLLPLSCLIILCR